MSCESLGRWRDFDSATGFRARTLPVDVHEGTPTDFLCRLESAACQAVQDIGETRQTYVEKLHDWTADTRNLKTAWDYLKSGGGHAPGIDGVRFEAVPDHQLWEHLRYISQHLVRETYEPAPLLRKEIPKGGNRGKRTLEIPTVFDRTVGRAVVQAVQPFLDPTFDDNSFGFRPRRDRRHALAKAEVIATRENRWHWITEDVRNAFPNVPRGRLIDVVRARLRNEKMVYLIEKLANNGRRRGIPQGQPLSPLLLNLYLDHHLDRPWRQSHPGTPLLRVADDLLILCQNRAEAEAAYLDLERMLTPTGMPLKGDPQTAIRDLKVGQEADWLGFNLSKSNVGLQALPSDRLWGKLEEKFYLAHLKPESPLMAILTVYGWIEQLGPSYPHVNVRRIISRVTTMARRYAFEEVPTYRELQEEWQRAYARWRHILASANRA